MFRGDCRRVRQLANPPFITDWVSSYGWGEGLTFCSAASNVNAIYFLNNALLEIPTFRRRNLNKMKGDERLIFVREKKLSNEVVPKKRGTRREISRVRHNGRRLTMVRPDVGACVMNCNLFCSDGFIWLRTSSTLSLIAVPVCMYFTW